MSCHDEITEPGAQPAERCPSATGVGARSSTRWLTRHNRAIGAERNIGQGAGAARLQELLGLSDDELCAALGVDPLTLLSGQLDHRPELGILLTLIDETQLEAQAGPQMLRRWVRASGPEGRPLDALTRRNFAAFEDALAQFAQRGFVLRGGGASAGG